MSRKTAKSSPVYQTLIFEHYLEAWKFAFTLGISSPLIYSAGYSAWVLELPCNTTRGN